MMNKIASTTILDLYEADGHAARKAGPREMHGPCPSCGGNDRFCIFPEQNSGSGSYFCGHGKLGNGCGKGGDAIQYLRDFRNLSFREACEFLGIEKATTGRAYLATPKTPRRPRQSTNDASPRLAPAEVVDVEKWRAHALKFVNNCHEEILARPKSLSWLAKRGIPLEAVKKYRLGLHLGTSRKGQDWEPDFRPWTSWGLRDEINPATGKPRKLILPAGIVVPYFRGSILQRVRIRLAKPNPQNPKQKYHVVKGSTISTWLSNPTAAALVVVETELDAVALDHAAGDFIGTVALGAVGIPPDAEAHRALTETAYILNALDYDQAAAKALEWWDATFQHSHRWPPPEGKDPGEAAELGVNLRLWLAAGLPEQMRPALGKEQLPAAPPEPEPKNEPAANQVAKPETAHGPQPLTEPELYPPRLAELIELLSLSRGSFRLHDKGRGIALEIPRKWAGDNLRAARRISELVYTSEEFDCWVSNWPDGRYSARDLQTTNPRS